MSLRFLIPLCPQAVRFQTFEHGGPHGLPSLAHPAHTFPKTDLQGRHLAGISVLATLEEGTPLPGGCLVQAPVLREGRHRGLRQMLLEGNGMLWALPAR